MTFLLFWMTIVFVSMTLVLLFRMFRSFDRIAKEQCPAVKYSDMVRAASKIKKSFARSKTLGEHIRHMETLHDKEFADRFTSEDMLAFSTLYGSMFCAEDANRLYGELDEMARTV